MPRKNLPPTSGHPIHHLPNYPLTGMIDTSPAPLKTPPPPPLHLHIHILYPRTPLQQPLPRLLHHKPPSHMVRLLLNSQERNSQDRGYHWLLISTERRLDTNVVLHIRLLDT